MYEKQYTLMLSISQLQRINRTPCVRFACIIDFEQQRLEWARIARTSRSLLNSLRRLERKQWIELHPNHFKCFRITNLGRRKMCVHIASR
jgi:hypothetical protein